ncbi:MAG: polysaccharide deacetylase family protein, partial [Ignavibacteriales bacterium]|nr:polysaccharide deacetylase family protein [Ignavibacteriales bacterium]
MIKRLIILFFTITYFASAQNYGTLSFTNYADDRKAAFSLTFDDGLLTHSTNVKPLLNQYGFKGTFYVLPPYLAEDNQPLIWRYGRWSDFQMIAA